jgi:type II secretory pathway component PulK
MISEIKKILQNQRGVALMMIMTAIIVLMAIYGEFTFDSKISRIKATNILDRSQAKLLAESGLQLGLARLRLYKEAYNKVQSNADAKNMVSTQLINQLWEVPFIFPVPITKDAPRAFRDTVEKFQAETLLEGEMKISIQNISNRLNLNLIRMDMSKFNPATHQADASSFLDQSDMAISTNVSIAQALFFSMKRLVEQKKNKDESFEQRHGDINYQEMVSNLKYFTSDMTSLEQDPMAGEAQSNFQKIPLTPKYGPMSSSSELYAIPGWEDELIELIQNEFSIYPSAQIDLNKLTENMLRILIPNMSEDDAKEFFLYRDDPETPKFFNTKEDFKRYIVEIARLMDNNIFDERMKLLEAKGIVFGSNPNLFKVVSEGSYNRSTYTLVAYVELPIQQNTAPTTPVPNPNSDPNTKPTGSNSATTPKQSAQLLDPRVIEIQIN